MSTIPSATKVLVIGGGPAGSYAAAVLAREGIEVVLLEAAKFPRYHVGESMLPSIRAFLRFIDCDEQFKGHGFIQKYGAAFKLNAKPDVFTDFVAAGGPEGYAWNVVRSEADEIIFRHARTCGAQTFDGVKVDSIAFADGPSPDQQRPKSASWSRQSDGTSGTITFDYLIDASGRAGLLSTRHLHSRRFNSNLKSIASWAYWRGGVSYGAGTDKEGWPFFEALSDGSGWCWYIPLHTQDRPGLIHSVGVVQRQTAAAARKREWAGVTEGDDAFYTRCLHELAPRINALLADAERTFDPGDKMGQGVGQVHTASDWSYSSGTYALPYARIAGDAGCFVDPFFSSGVHVALTSALSAALTVAASVRGDCDETAAGAWHSKRVAEAYTRFFLVVSATMRQIGKQDAPVLSEIDEDGFDRAFGLFRTVIQGTVDTVNGKGSAPTAVTKEKTTTAPGVTTEDISRTVDFCVRRFTDVSDEQTQSVLAKLRLTMQDLDKQGGTEQEAVARVVASLEPDERGVFEVLMSRRMLQRALFDGEESMFSLDAIDGLAPRVERGHLGLTPVCDTGEEGVSKLGGVLAGIERHSHFKLGRSGEEGVDGALPAANGDGHKATRDMHVTNGHGRRSETTVTKEIPRQLRRCVEDALESLENRQDLEKPQLDDASRLALLATMQRTVAELETPWDTFARLAATTRDLPMVVVGQKLGIFTALSSSPQSLSPTELARSTGADPALVRRVIRYLAGVHMVDVATSLHPGDQNHDESLYIANTLTHRLANPDLAGALRLLHTTQAPVWQQLPAWLEANHFRDITTEQESLWLNHDFCGNLNPTGLSWHAWLEMHPAQRADYARIMALPRGGTSNCTWLDVTHFRRPTNPEDVLLVDIGGNQGQQCAAAIAQHPHLAGYTVLQDRAEVIASMPPVPGVRALAHDFFLPQPESCRGARYYLIRSVLHNYDDEHARVILRCVADAMGPRSELLVDEMVLPGPGEPVSDWASGQDLGMMAFFGARERDRSAWTALLDSAGLAVVDVREYAPGAGRCVIVGQLL